jgi:NAD(P)H-dependent flavin oxidoreductase YrpB (nitropropane dioxygenase family)
MQTELAERLGVEFPIVAFSHCRDVVAAVSRAGGLGVLGAVVFTPEQLAVELDWIDQQVGTRPYGVDVLIPPAKPSAGGAGGKSQPIPDGHREFVAGLLERYGVPELGNGPTGPARFDVSEEAGRRLVETALSHPNVRLVANALGPAPRSLVEAAHAKDVLVAGLVGKVEHARAQVAAGVDVIVAQGTEAGGHTGEISTMVLTPQVVDAVAPIPVLAAGGIATGRQMAAALALGAQGVWCGSVWLTTEEAETNEVVKEKFLAAGSSDTVRTRASTGKPARQLRSAWTEAWDDPANPDPLPMPFHTHLIGRAQQRIAAHAAHNDGARDLVNYFVGQVVGQLDRVKPARQVVFEMVEEYIETMERLNRSMPS